MLLALSRLAIKAPDKCCEPTKLPAAFLRKSSDRVVPKRDLQSSLRERSMDYATGEAPQMRGQTQTSFPDTPYRPHHTSVSNKA